MIVRNIYEKVDYEEYEITSIDDFKTTIQVPLPNTWKTSDYLKMLISADFSIQGALQNLQIHLGWLNLYQNMEPNIDQLKCGDFYIFGIDKQSRPVIIIKNLENQNFLTFQYILETVKRQVLIPYFVENWTIIYDCQNQEYNFYEIDFNFDNIKELMINFCGNLNNLLIVNSKLNCSQILNYLPNRNQIHSKIKLLNNLDDLQQYISKEQLEEKYNGECSNVTTFWPPQVPQVSELLKQFTYDCYEDYYSQLEIVFMIINYSSNILQIFQKSLKISKILQLFTHSQQYGLRKLQDFKCRNLRKFSSLGRISCQHSKTASMKKSIESATSASHLKIFVLEENGNQLIQEEIEVLNNQGESEADNQRKMDLDIYKTESVGLQLLEENNKGQIQIILETEHEIEYKCCPDKSNCMIF